MRSGGLSPWWGALGAALAVGLVASCARQGTPRGGPPDNLPPEVVSTRPDTFARVEELREPIRIQFSERISEQPATGTLDDAVLVSPRSGDVKVKHKRDALEVELSEGLRPGQVYRVTVLPVIRDLFQNTMAAPFEFVFSTGGEYSANAVVGLVVDRITGQMVDGADVVARPDWTDTLDLAYVSRTDTSGIYALRYLPVGRYRIQAFEDRNRNFEVDPFEIQGETPGIVGATDTVFYNVIVLAPDTTPARLARVELVDSVRLRLTFDDYLDPMASPDGVDVSLAPVPDTTEEGVVVPPPAPPLERVFQERQYTAWQDSVAEAQARADSIAAAAADSAGTDTTAAARAAADSVAGAARAATARRAAAAARTPRRPGNVPTRPGQAPTTLPDGSPLPAQTLVVALQGPLPAGSTYLVTVAGVTNVNGLGGGGGEGRVSREAPPPDTAAAAPDTANAVPDTAAVPPDTAAVTPPDTSGTTPPDTSGTTPPDTSGAEPPDTGLTRPSAREEGGLRR